MGDLFDLEGVLKRNWDTNSLSQIVSCSALVKIVGDYEDIYIAHDAWFLYRGMLRVQKRYIFPWHRTAHLTGIEDIIPGHTITMSSYAGNLVSWDNFYLSSTGLAITETSIVNRNLDLWDTVVPESGALTWIRSAIATRLAVTGKEWVDIITRDNSGTYFPDVMTISNQLPVVEQYGDFYTFENCPRAKIFRRDHVKVKDMKSMLKLMRYNDFRNDPLSVCNCTPPYNPTYAIAARFDLFDPQGTYDMPGMYRHAVGGIDAKVTNYRLFSSLDLVGVSGPTWDDQPPFQWSTSGFTDGHVGQPDRWQFDPAQYKWAEPRLQWR
ncbi:hypothetical protein HPB50_002717 [Hyalomma asiaticum]|uniref:Uncharacterized protein n=1 Tax=Hyalomma asiaticum TaxID=266040 RepID=A0ACB7TE76_HYAAI|nr:hypothetical protein HPB50_002717 [Hyalomma asiaticum]